MRECSAFSFFMQGERSLVQSQTSESPIVISGKGLYVAILTVLTVASVLADSLAGRFSQPLTSVTLPFVLTTGLVSLLGLWAVPLLQRLKAGQVIREDGPQSHLAKAGTPTMGGIFFVPVALLMSIILSSIGFASLKPELIATLLLTLVLGGLGFVDDLQVLLKKSNKGISAKLRLAIEFGSGLIFALWLLKFSPTVTTVNFPLGLSIPLGFLFVGLAVFVVAAESNAVNLTDGMDGLAAGTCAIALLGLGLVVANDWPSLMIFCACLSGGCIGFLMHNHNPAKVFMGDTGSLALGASLAAVGLISNSLWALFIISGLFLAESLSVISQVLYYKATKDSDGQGKRLFKMAPLHHHFELSGWHETKVVGIFYLIVFGLTLGTIGISSFG